MGAFRLKAAVLVLFLATLPGCSSLLFFPEKQLVTSPKIVGLAYEDVFFASADGTRLHGWFLPAHGEPAATVLFYHGNAQNISTHLGSVFWLPERGYNVFLFDYRGFGRSGGKAKLNGVHKDAAAALAYVRARPDVDASRLVVLGQSIGASISAYTVAHADKGGIRALVLESSFSSYRSITREKLGDFFLTWPLQWPLSFLMPNRYSALPQMEKIAPVPVLLIHGDADAVVSPRHSERLFAAASEPKTLWRVPGGGHIDAFVRLPAANRERLIGYLESALAGPVPSLP